MQDVGRGVGCGNRGGIGGRGVCSAAGLRWRKRCVTVVVPDHSREGGGHV